KDRIEGQISAAKVSPELLEQFRAAVQSRDPVALDTLLTEHPDLKSQIDKPMFETDQPAIVFLRTNRPLVDVLLKHGADINGRSQFWARSVGVLDEQTPEMAAYLISRGAVP